MKMHWLDRNAQSIRCSIRAGLVGAVVLVVSGSGAISARASCPPDLPAPRNAPVTEAHKARAVALFQTGNNLLQDNDHEGALELFLQSRALSPRLSNTKNAAICLLALRRFPEALALYEEILDRHSADIDAVEQKAIADKIFELRAKIVTVHIDGREGTFSIDGDACGSLPRSTPVYVKPGPHILRISRAGSPDYISQFSGNANESVRPPIPASEPVVMTTSGAWFAYASVGPAVGLSGMSFDDNVPLEPMAGLLAQARGGYRLANGLSLALASGVLWVERSYDDPVISRTFGENGQFQATYEIGHRIQTLAPFMGAAIGIESKPVNHWNLWAHTGFGILGAQSKDLLGVGIKTAATVVDSEENPNQVLIEGRESTAHSVPFYASLDIGFSRRFGAFRIGVSIESLLFFVHSPPLPSGRVGPSGTCETSDDAIACVPAITLTRTYAYRPTFLVIPQLVVGFAP